MKKKHECSCGRVHTFKRVGDSVTCECGIFIRRQFGYFATSREVQWPVNLTPNARCGIVTPKDLRASAIERLYQNIRKTHDEKEIDRNLDALLDIYQEEMEEITRGEV